MNDLVVDLCIPFPSEREADITYQTLRVDLEPKRSGITKILILKSNTLHVIFSGNKVRKLRVGITSFFDSLLLVTKTMKEFHLVEPFYNHY